MPYLRHKKGGFTKGFTFIETALVISLVAALATSATPLFIDINRQAQLTAEQAVVGHVQTGITLYQMESLATARARMNPQTLDNANFGLATPTNQLFFNILSPPVMTGWSKESQFAYRSPTGNPFIYNPTDGTFTGQGGQTTPGGSGSSLGNLAFQFAGIAFYDSGAIVDTTSNLAYIPSFSGGQVSLTLLSGTKITTHEDGSALVTLADGKSLTVADIHKPNFFKLSSDTQAPNQYEYSYLWVQGGQAGESNHKTNYFKKEYQADEKGGSFRYEYTSDGDYSGGSLKKEYGTIYKTDYSTDKPQVSEGSWTKKANGNIEGSMKHTYNYKNDTVYGYNHPEAKYRYAFLQNGAANGESDSNYTYDAKKEVYSSAHKGRHGYQMDYDTSTFGKRKFQDQYEYEGTSEYDKKNEVSKSETRYRHQDGRDITYRYQYNGKDKSYEWAMVDNKTGKEKIQKGKIAGDGNNSDDDD